MGPRALHLGLLGACAVIGACSGSAGEKPLSKTAPAEEDKIPKVPVPPEDGPKLYATKPGTKVLDRPSKKGNVLGELRMGAPVARAAQAIGSKDCEGGWFPVRPRGFVCVGDGASLVAGPVVRAPALDRALPHRYATATSATPLYERLPSPEEQAAAEPGLDKHFGKLAKAPAKTLGQGTNDVPLDGRGVASGLPVLSKSSEGVGEDGNRTSATFFADLPAHLPPPTRPEQLLAPVVAGVLRKGASLAITDVIVAEGPSGARSFAVTTSGQMVPLDRLEPIVGSIWHGVALGEGENKLELPLAFTLRNEIVPYDIEKRKATRREDDEFPRRAVIQLTGKFRTIDDERFDETKEGTWVRAKDVLKVVKRSKWPDFVAEGVRWIDVSLALQSMTLYEGRKPLYVTLISSGGDVLGDPETSSATPRGTFAIDRAHVMDQLAGPEVQDAYEVLDVPWVLGFAPGVEMFGTYFGDRAGEARFHHDIGLTPIDARRVFNWAAGEPPSGWASWAIPEDQRVTVLVRP